MIRAKVIRLFRGRCVAGNGVAIRLGGGSFYIVYRLLASFVASILPRAILRWSHPFRRFFALRVFVVVYDDRVSGAALSCSRFFCLVLLLSLLLPDPSTLYLPALFSSSAPQLTLLSSLDSAYSARPLPCLAHQFGSTRRLIDGGELTQEAEVVFEVEA